MEHLILGALFMGGLSVAFAAAKGVLGLVLYAMTLPERHQRSKSAVAFDAADGPPPGFALE